MRCKFIAVICLLLGMNCPISAVAQDSIESSPLTFDALFALPMEQLARRLLGPAGELVTTQIPTPSSSVLNFLTAPRVSASGLCERTLHSVRLIYGDASSGNNEIQIADVRSATHYLVVGDLLGPERDALTPQEHETCERADYAAWGFGALSREEAWRLAYLLDAAIASVRDANGDMPQIECSLRPEQCDHVGDLLLRLTSRNIVSTGAGCSHLSSNVTCYRYRVHEDFYTWFVEIAADNENRIGATYFLVRHSVLG